MKTSTRISLTSGVFLLLISACAAEHTTELAQASQGQDVNTCGRSDLPGATDEPVVFVHGFSSSPYAFEDIALAFEVECRSCGDYSIWATTQDAFESSCPAGSRLEDARCCGTPRTDEQAIYLPQVPSIEGTLERGVCLQAHIQAAADIYSKHELPANRPVHCMGQSQGGSDCVWLSQNTSLGTLASLTTFNTPFEGSLASDLPYLLLKAWQRTRLTRMARAGADLGLPVEWDDNCSVYTQHFASYALPLSSNDDLLPDYLDDVVEACHGLAVDGIHPSVENSESLAVVREYFEHSWPLVNAEGDQVVIANDGIVPVFSQRRGTPATWEFGTGIPESAGTQSIFRGCFSADHWITSGQSNQGDAAEPIAVTYVIPTAIRELATLECR
jgi:hypothetical protein